ncbi:MAG: hypothetical protein ACTSVE_13660, partial [Candidatus Helarchaeota archaeon]
MRKKQKSMIITSLFILSVLIGYTYMMIAPNQFATINQSINMSTDTWNITWRYKLNLTFTEPGSGERTNWPVDINLNFSNGECINNSIRVLDNNGQEIPSQVWDVIYYSGTSYIASAKVTFLINILNGETKHYQVWYSDEPNPFPEADYSSFGNGLNVTFDGQKATVINEKFTVNFEEGLGVNNFTLNAINQNFHTNSSLSPNIYNTFPSENEYVFLMLYEHLIFIAKESGVIRLYDGVTNDLIAQHTFQKNELWRYPGTTDRYFSNLFDKLIRIDSDIEASMFVTGLGEDNVHGGGGIVNNYYSGTDHRSDDAIYSAYGSDLLLWIPRDLYITAYEPTQVQIIDLDTDDGDSDDSKTIILGPTADTTYGWGWNTSMNSLIYTNEQYNSYYPAGDPSGNDNNNPDIFDNDIVRIIANTDISVIAGYCGDNYNTEVIGKDGKIFHFPILYRFILVATEDNTQVSFSNLSDPNPTTSLLKSYIIANDITGYRTNFGDYSQRFYLTPTEISTHTVTNLMAGDTIEFWDWLPDRNRTTGNYNYDSDAGSNIYDRWGVAPDFYKGNWANITADKPVRVYTGTSPAWNDIDTMKTTDRAILTHRNDQILTLVGTEDNTQVSVLSTEDRTGSTDHTTVIVKAVDINNDGVDEAVVGGHDIVLYNLTDNSEIWKIPIWAPSAYGMGRANWDDFKYISQIKFANLTGDDYLDVIISTSSYRSEQAIQAIDGKTGSILWQNETYFYGPTNFEVGDINNDGLQDVVVLTYNNRRFIGFNSTNGEYLFYQYCDPGYGEGMKLIDADGDNNYEAIVVAFSNNYLYTYNMSTLLYSSYWNSFYNKPGWTYRRLSQSSTYNNRVALSYDFRRLDVSDLQGDNSPKIIVGKGNEGSNCIVEAYNYNPSTRQIGSVNWSHDFGLNRHRPYSFAIAEISGDSALDVIVGLDQYDNNRNESTVYALNGLNGNELWNSGSAATDWVMDIEANDLNQDGQFEIIIGEANEKYSTTTSYQNTIDGNVTILNSTNGNLINNTVTSEGWVRSITVANLNASTKAILASCWTDSPQ